MWDERLSEFMFCLITIYTMNYDTYDCSTF